MLNRLLTEEIRLLRMERYGKKAEKLTDAQLQMFDEEPGVLEAEVEQEAELPESHVEKGSVHANTQNGFIAPMSLDCFPR